MNTKNVILAILVAVALTIGAMQWIFADVPGQRTWTAPVDYVDQAHTQTRAIMQYDGRLSTDPDSLVNAWQNCTQWIDSRFTPGAPGTQESYTIPDSLLPGGTVYFILFAIDSAFNRSAVAQSNIHMERIDREPPAAVTDLR